MYFCLVKMPLTFQSLTAHETESTDPIPKQMPAQEDFEIQRPKPPPSISYKCDLCGSSNLYGEEKLFFSYSPSSFSPRFRAVIKSSGVAIFGTAGPISFPTSPPPPSSVQFPFHTLDQWKMERGGRRLSLMLSNSFRLRRAPLVSGWSFCWIGPNAEYHMVIATTPLYVLNHLEAGPVI